MVGAHSDNPLVGMVCRLSYQARGVFLTAVLCDPWLQRLGSQ